MPEESREFRKIYTASRTVASHANYGVFLEIDFEGWVMKIVAFLSIIAISFSADPSVGISFIL